MALSINVHATISMLRLSNFMQETNRGFKPNTVQRPAAFRFQNRIRAVE
jgi:hypothetical protein